MENETLDTALNEISSILRRCEKIQPQFAEGSAQHSLLKNRIAALQAADLLLKRERWGEHTDQGKIQPSAASDAVSQKIENLTREDFMKALAPIQSIIHKCRTAQAKHAETSATFRRLQKQIDAMTLAETLIQKELAADHSWNEADKL